MKGVWSLNELYDSFESKKFKTDIEICEGKIREISEYARDNLCDGSGAAIKLETFLRLYNGLMGLLEQLLYYAHLTMSTDVTSLPAIKTMDALEAMDALLAEPKAAVIGFVSKIPDLGAVIQSSEYLSEHSFAINEMKDKAKRLLAPEAEACIAKMEITGSGAWERLREQITATLFIDITIDGKAKREPLSVIRNYAYSPDGKLRKNAYERELAAYETVETPIAACLNAIKGEVITVSGLRGYASPLEMTLENERMDKKTLDALMAAIRKYQPVFNRFLKHKAKLLGKDKLPFFDLFAPLGSLDIKYTFSGAKAFVYKNFSSFSPRLGAFAKRAFDNKWIDVYPRAGKVGGAFCASIHKIEESRILMNFGGSFSDVTTLAHELGHGYHNECLRGQSFINCEYTMPIAETASTFCETLVINAALKNADKEASLAIINTDLTNAAQVITDIYSRYLFELKVFELRAKGPLSADELKGLMANAQKEAYGDALDDNFLHPGAWIPKAHYYHAHTNFYNFPYAYGFLFSKGLYAEYLKKGSAFADDYDALLSVTGRETLRGVGQKAGIDVRDKAFWENALKLVADEIELFVNM